MSAYVVVQHKIGTWSEFENIFRSDAERRKILGSKGGKVLRSLEDPQSVFILFEWEDVEGAQKFVNGLETHEAMEWATSGIWSRTYVADEVFDIES